MQDTTSRIVEEIRVAMTRKRISQIELAAQLGIDRGKVQRRLAGHVDFTISELTKLAPMLDLELSSLVRPDLAQADVSALAEERAS